MLRIGIIGAGRISRVHARSINANPQAQLVMIADPAKQTVESLAQEYGARASYDPSEVFSAADVDAIIICSPTPFHVEHIVAAAKAGKPALCEKPVAMESVQIEELNEQLKGLNPTVMLGFNRRFDPSFARTYKLATEGAVGVVEQVTIISRDPAAPPKEYIAVSGGIFKDMTIHDFDMARFFLGDIVEVSAIGQNLDPALSDTGDYDAAIVTLTNAQGKCATIINSRHCASGYDQRLEVFGDKGALFAENVRPTTVRFSNSTITDAQDTYLDFFLDRYVDAYTNELNEFIDAAINGRVPSPNINDGAAALLIAEAALVSAKTGSVVKL